MLKTIVTTMVASMLFVFPIVFFISQTVVGGDGNEYVVCEQLVAEGNNINGGDITQVSTVVTGDPISEGNSDGNNNDGSGGNSGEGNNDGSGGSSSESNSGGDSPGGSSESSSGDSNGGSNSASNEAHQSNSVGGSSGGSGEAELVTAGQTYGDSAKSIVINKIYPYTETPTAYGNGEIELYNTGNTPVNIDQWYMKNITGHVMGTINNKEIAPSGFLVVDVTGLTRDYQRVTLFDSDGNKIDSVMYTGARSHNGLSYARVPNGANIWKWST